MSLIDKNGNEVIKISNGEIAPKAKLINVEQSGQYNLQIRRHTLHKQKP